MSQLKTLVARDLTDSLKKTLAARDLSDSIEEDLSGIVDLCDDNKPCGIDDLSEVDHPCVYNDLSEVVSTLEATVLVRLFQHLIVTIK